ncbi:MAG: prephenate dehydrogenase/arogenate dehydrogenase family protein [Oscillospiraceae bacterium]|jgi:prephenate dehydrogenase|nr:prephenate dehydrogenase/arogenate dehydrogenase family protein [Oscillospiraceae bacterium]
MKIAIIGLGLIGGSLAKAVKVNTDDTVYGFDIDSSVTQRAIAEGAVDFAADTESFAQCDLFVIALYPGAAAEFFLDNVRHFKSGAVAVDCAGVKAKICEQLESAAKQHGVHFIGGHPMAGIECSGYENSFAELFKNANMILCPYEGEDRLEFVKEYFLRLGFSGISVTSPQEHDKVIAYTSQLAHIVSSAYAKSKFAKKHTGFSAGSYRDLTRVAKLNEDMWAELFMENRSNLLGEIDNLIARLKEYHSALSGYDSDRLKLLLLEGKKIISN